MKTKDIRLVEGLRNDLKGKNISSYFRKRILGELVDLMKRNHYLETKNSYLITKIDKIKEEHTLLQHKYDALKDEYKEVRDENYEIVDNCDKLFMRNMELEEGIDE